MQRDISRFHDPLVSSGSINSQSSQLKAPQTQRVVSQEPHFRFSSREYQQICASIRADNLDKIRSLVHFPIDNNIEDFLRWRQFNDHHDSCRYWMYHLPSAEDRQSLKPLAGVEFYNQLSEFINSKVMIMQSPQYDRASTEKNESLFKRILDNYRSKITRQSKEFRDIVTRGDYPDFTSALFGFNGLNVNIGGQAHDLSQKHAKKPYFLSNIISNTESFVSYMTSELLKNSFESGDLKTHTGIYLNPHIGVTVSVLSEIIEQLEHERLPAHIKILNRAGEASKQHILEIQSESIVIYTSVAHTDQVLNIILDYYKQNYSFFMGRPTPKLAIRVADGIAIATQEGYDEKYSFNSHRSLLIDQVWEDFKFYNMSNSFSQSDIQVFRQLLMQKFQQNQIDTHNIAFPDPLIYRTLGLSK